MSKQKMTYDGGKPNPKLRVASKVNKGGTKKAPAKGDKSSGGTKMW